MSVDGGKWDILETSSGSDAENWDSDDNARSQPAYSSEGSAAAGCNALPREILDTPLRLTPEERTMLRLLEGALETSDYVDKVDNVLVGSRSRRVLMQLTDLLTILAGLRVASGGAARVRHGVPLAAHAAWFAHVFEVGRRHKIMNPSKMRSTYGKLMYVLQDAEQLHRNGTLAFSLWSPLRTARSTLFSSGRDGNVAAAALMRDSRLVAAVAPVPPGVGVDESRALQSARDAARQSLLADYIEVKAKPKLRVGAQELTLVLDSITDGLAHIAMVHRPIDRMLELLAQVDAVARSKADSSTAASAPVAAATRQSQLQHSSASVDKAHAQLVSRAQHYARTTHSWRALLGANHDGGLLVGAALTCCIGVAISRGGWWWAMALLAVCACRYWQVAWPEGASLLGGGSRGDSGGIAARALLAIRSGRSGSCLSHTHAQQVVFVQQTLLLWRTIAARMSQLWAAAERDLVDRGYMLRDTGQGLHRVQAAPRVARIMSDALEGVRSASGAPWVGLSVVHLGDDDVPNALVFIDKYTQLSHILHPVVQAVDILPSLWDTSEASVKHKGASGAGGRRDEKDQCDNPPRGGGGGSALESYVRATFGSVETARIDVLGDWFRHGFDGSGDSGGSCIDGRLTSAWNWCSQLDKKHYAPLFHLSGFTGFDGDFNEE